MRELRYQIFNVLLPYFTDRFRAPRVFYHYEDSNGGYQCFESIVNKLMHDPKNWDPNTEAIRPELLFSKEEVNGEKQIDNA